MRRKEQVRYAAYAGSLVAAVPQFATRRGQDGNARQGFLPSLGPSLGGGEFEEEGEVLGSFVASGLPVARALEEAWSTMQAEVRTCSKEGPLSEPITGRAASIKGHLQREITKHREVAEVEKLGGEMKGMMREGTWEQTRPGDPRANAFLSCDAFSSQILLALPNNHHYMAPVDFADTVARYLGVPLPSIVEGGLEGLEMPCSVMRGEGRSRRRRKCDAHGHQMELANLPDNMLKVESEALEKAVHATLRYAGFDARWQDRLTFRTGTGERPPIVPDITSKLRVGEGPELTYLMDVKTVRLSGDTAGYSVRGSYDRPHGAMDVRGRQVPEEYLAKARRARVGQYDGESCVLCIIRYCIVLCINTRRINTPGGGGGSADARTAQPRRDVTY